VDRRHGTERVLAEVLERLAGKYGCEIHLYAQRVEDLALARSAASRGEECGGIVWHKVPSIPGPHLLQFLFWLFLNASCRGWDRAIRGLQFDLVLSPGINCFDADVVIVHALFYRLRKLAREESGPGRPGFHRRFHRHAYYSLLTWLEHRIYTGSKVSLAAVSRRTAALLNEYFHREDVRVIPNGVDAAQFSPARRLALRAEARSRQNFLESDFVLLLIGNDWHTKGLSTILTAMAASPEIPLGLLVAGQDAMTSSFREAARSLRLSEKCRWETASVDAIDLYAAADLYVSPSGEDSFGLPVAEAMACGLPVITSVQAGVSQIITEGVDGFILNNPGDSAALAQLVRRLYQHPDLCRRVGENAAHTAQSYTWDRCASETWEFLKEARARKSSS
jgi:glycosyltransferase involved in cell wall biosynthesis